MVCDLTRFEVHTNFTGASKKVYAFSLRDLASGTRIADTNLTALDVLRALFNDPDRLRPRLTTAQVTEAAAREFSKLADSLRARGVEPSEAAHFLMRLLFCLFAEDIGLLPEKLFTRLVENTRALPANFRGPATALFDAMATGGFFGVESIAYFNGGLFAGGQAIDLTRDDLEMLLRACRLDWTSVEPAIFGTLFERSLDPSKRVQLGAHYTSNDDILLIVEPVLMAPLRREWVEIEEKAVAIVEMRDAAIGGSRTRYARDLEKLLVGFSTRLSNVRVLDPACGSGNFLYVALKQLMDLEKEVVTFATSHGMSAFFPQVDPEQLHGIELNEYAHELAQIVIWIGYIQWLHGNGFGIPSDPILKPLSSIVQKDAILTHDKDGQLIEPSWPQADVIVGNPPFLGGNKIRHELGDAYVDSLFKLYTGRVPAFADLVCYWFERAREQIATGRARRAGLMATQGIRGGANRKVLERIQRTGDIFWAQSDRDWMLEGAAVNVSMVGFDDGSEADCFLDDLPVVTINADLTGTVNATLAKQLQENTGICFMGPSPKASFDIDADLAQVMLDAPLNTNWRPNSDVVRPVASGIDLVQRNRHEWTIDFGLLPLEEAAQFQLPFEYVRKHVYPVRSQNRRRSYAEKWWQYAEARPGMRAALRGKVRFVATPAVSKHRIFVWVEARVLCNQGTLVYARDDDYFFGILHSKPHELWALRRGTALEERPRYTPTTTFATFPFPWPVGHEPHGERRANAVAAASRELVEKRDRWLHVDGASETELRRRTLTNLYNERPTWLDIAQRKLDEAVFDAYGWPHDLTGEQILGRLLQLNLERAASEMSGQSSADPI